MLPIESIAAAAESIARGEAGRVPLDGPAEYGRIAASVHALSDELRRERSQRAGIERFASAGRLSAGIAHELLNPLGAVAATLGRLRARTADQADTGVLFEQVDRELARADRIARGLIDLSRSRTPAPLKFDFNEAVRSAVRVLTDRGAVRHHVVSLQLDTSEPIVFGSGHDIEQSFINLLLNALDATPSGGSISVHSHRFPRAASKTASYDALVTPRLPSALGRVILA